MAPVVTGARPLAHACAGAGGECRSHHQEDGRCHGPAAGAGGRGGALDAAVKRLRPTDPPPHRRLPHCLEVKSCSATPSSLLASMARVGRQPASSFLRAGGTLTARLTSVCVPFLLSSCCSFVSYLGPFSREFRDTVLHRDLLASAQKLGIPTTPGLQVRSLPPTQARGRPAACPWEGGGRGQQISDWI